MRRLIRIGLKEIDSVGRRPKLIQNGLKGLGENRADRGTGLGMGRKRHGNRRRMPSRGRIVVVVVGR